MVGAVAATAAIFRTEEDNYRDVDERSKEVGKAIDSMNSLQYWDDLSSEQQTKYIIKALDHAESD